MCNFFYGICSIVIMYSLIKRVCRYSFCNSDTTMDDNIRYFMYKHNLLNSDWYDDLSQIYLKIDAHAHSIMMIFALRERSENCVKLAITVSLNLLTLPKLTA